MSWFWGSSKEKTRSEPERSISEGAPIAQPKSITPNSNFPTSSPSQPLSREERATQELNELLKEFQQHAEVERDSRLKVKEAAWNRKRQEDGNSSGPYLDSDPNVNANLPPPIPQDISPDSLYPTEMSCRSSLDYAMFCQSLGGQFVNVYRYGKFRSCSNHWNDFWMCMRTRSWDEKDRARAVQDHHKQKAITWKTGPSSEDVWAVRTEPVRDAFQDNLEELESKIAEWKRANPGVQDPWNKLQGSSFSNPASTA